MCREGPAARLGRGLRKNHPARLHTCSNPLLHRTQGSNHSPEFLFEDLLHDGLATGLHGLSARVDPGALRRSPVEEAAKPGPAAEADDLVAIGEKLAGQNACLGCHSTDGTRRVGPSFKGLLGSERTVTKNGQTINILADSDYLIRAIREPGTEVTEGYPAAMPPYPGLSDDDIRAIEAWLETLK